MMPAPKILLNGEPYQNIESVKEIDPVIEKKIPNTKNKIVRSYMSNKSQFYREALMLQEEKSRVTSRIVSLEDIDAPTKKGS